MEGRDRGKTFIIKIEGGGEKEGRMKKMRRRKGRKEGEEVMEKKWKECGGRNDMTQKEEEVVVRKGEVY